MTQKQGSVPQNEKQKPASQEEVKHKGLNEELLNKLNSVEQTQNDEWVWVCSTRLAQGGCLRIQEGRPPVCPIYSRDKDPLFIAPVLIRKSHLLKRLDSMGSVCADSPMIPPHYIEKPTKHEEEETERGWGKDGNYEPPYDPDDEIEIDELDYEIDELDYQEEDEDA